jgi:hypothetical protein
VAEAIRSANSNAVPFDLATVNDGLCGMRFIDAVIESDQSNAKWIPIKK